MICKYGEAQQMTLNSGILSGLQINVLLVASATNTPLVAADFVPANVQIKVELRRGGSTFTIMQDNLLLLGTYFARKRNLYWFMSGFPLKQAASGVAQNQLLVAKLRFDSCLHLTGDDLVTVQVNNAVGSMSSAVNTSNSYVEFLPESGMGSETGIPCTKFEVVQQNVPQQSFVNTDGVSRIQFLNFDMTDLSTPVISTASLNSNEYSHNATFNQLLGDEAANYGIVPAFQYGTSLPVNPSSPTVQRGLDVYPQSFEIYPAEPKITIGHPLTKVRLNFSFNAAVVNAGQNYVGHTQILMTSFHKLAAAQKIANNAKAAINNLG